MQLVHRPETGDSRALASDLEFADSMLSQFRGLMFRRSLAEDTALVFRFDSAAKRDLHMLFVPFAIDALWIVDNEVQAKKRLKPWIGLGRETADMVVELPAGAADGVEVGDTVELVGRRG